MVVTHCGVNGTYVFLNIAWVIYFCILFAFTHFRQTKGAVFSNDVSNKRRLGLNRGLAKITL